MEQKYWDIIMLVFAAKQDHLAGNVQWYTEQGKHDHAENERIKRALVLDLQRQLVDEIKLEENKN